MKHCIRFPGRLLLLVLISGLFLAACKEKGGTGAERTVQVQGRVTDEAGYGKRMGGIGGASVQAAEIRTDGSLRVLEGEGRSDAGGYFDFLTEATLLPVLIRAETASEIRMVAVDGGLSPETSLQVSPLTLETTLEADLYHRMFQESGAGMEAMTVLDVALAVNTQAAVELSDQVPPVADLAAAVRTGVHVRRAFLAERARLSASALSRLKEQFQLLYRTFMGHMYAEAENTAALTMRSRWLEEEFLRTYREEGVAEMDLVLAMHAQVEALRMEARNRRVNAGLLVGLVQQGSWLFALEAMHLAEQRFRERSGTSEPPQALLEARQQLDIAIHAASSLNDLTAARRAYREVLLEQLAVTAGLSAEVIAGWENALVSNAYAVLQNDLQAAASAEDAVSAYLRFADHVRTTAQSLVGERLEAQFVVDVLILAVLF